MRFFEPGATPSANWISATLPFFARAGVDAVVTPQMAPPGGNERERAAASIAESRVGGSLRFRFTPGAIRFVSDFPAASFLVRREQFLALDASTPAEEVVHELDTRGGKTIYLPEASVTIPPAPLFLAHLRRVAAYARSRGALARRRGTASGRGSAIVVFVLLGWALAGWPLVLAGPAGRAVWLTIWIAYAATVASAALFGGLRFHSLRVGLLTAAGLPLTHIVYALAFVSGFVRRG